MGIDEWGKGAAVAGGYGISSVSVGLWVERINFAKRGTQYLSPRGVTKTLHTADRRSVSSVSSVSSIPDPVFSLMSTSYLAHVARWGPVL